MGVTLTTKSTAPKLRQMTPAMNMGLGDTLTYLAASLATSSSPGSPGTAAAACSRQGQLKVMETGMGRC
jgi:hypothetical protein